MKEEPHVWTNVEGKSMLHYGGASIPVGSILKVYSSPDGKSSEIRLTDGSVVPFQSITYEQLVYLLEKGVLPTTVPSE